MEDRSQLADRILDQVADAVIYANRSGEIIRWNRCYDESKPLFITDIGPIIEIVGKCDADHELGTELCNKKTIGAALEKMEILKGGEAYIRVRRNRELEAPRRETQGFYSGGEDKEVPTDAVTLFMYRLKKSAKGEAV